MFRKKASTKDKLRKASNAVYIPKKEWRKRFEEHDKQFREALKEADDNEKWG